ncbi:hypothetical protein V6N13_104778 [Hibiscus sabdariffa]|uniref:Uncharacterized protein n=2 Tax=Hibiscus sabdariffa TaxID=183260 RepID=A0ABR2SI37_9ROSI
MRNPSENLGGEFPTLTGTWWSVARNDSYPKRVVIFGTSWIVIVVEAQPVAKKGRYDIEPTLVNVVDDKQLDDFFDTPMGDIDETPT